MRKLCLLLCLLSCAICPAQQVWLARGTTSNLLAPPRQQHQFFDKTNLALHGWNLAAETYDAITTRQSVSHHPINELNPFGAVFVNHGWGGQVVFSYGFGVGGPC